MHKLIQSMNDAADGLEAFDLLAFMKTQVDFVAGRVLTPSASKPGWRVQTFFKTNDCDSEWLPDGMRHVLVPDSLLRSCVQ